jgi:lysyl-tRNA synthetase class 2
MGILTLAILKEANPNKLFNDLGGMRKKLKIDVALPSKEEIIAWIG